MIKQRTPLHGTSWELAYFSALNQTMYNFSEYGASMEQILLGLAPTQHGLGGRGVQMLNCYHLQRAGRVHTHSQCDDACEPQVQTRPKVSIWPACGHHKISNVLYSVSDHYVWK